MPEESNERASATALALRYSLGLTFAQLLTVAEVAAVVISLFSQVGGAPVALLDEPNLVLLAGLVTAGTVATFVAAYWSITPSLRWYAQGTQPDPRQQRYAVNLVRRQTAILFTTWAVAVAGLIAANTDAGGGTVAMLIGASAFGATSSFSTSLLFTQRIYRPVVAAANREFNSRVTAPGVVARLVMMWAVNSALPSVAIALLVIAHTYGWFVPTTASVVVPVVVLTAVSVALGLRALILVSRSISDPINDVVTAMADVERGEFSPTVDVYEQSEIGRLQHGFNRMVAGLSERDRLQELFGRHVGPAVARRAVETGETPASEVRDVAILFIDLTDFTRLAANRAPQEVADTLNAFFRIVVDAVDERRGLINKFQGDAALAVFGAPLALDDHATAALVTARALSADLKALPSVDFGIGVSAGAVFAGNIGGESRYEYTVIGDPVNEAARLADVAKTLPERTAASGAAVDVAAATERPSWRPQDAVVLRGRAEPTQVWLPRRDDDDNGEHD